MHETQTVNNPIINTLEGDWHKTCQVTKIPRLVTLCD